MPEKPSMPIASTPQPAGLIRRISNGVRAFIREVTPGTWMGPGQPVAPVAPPDVLPRRLDYPVGYNYAMMPRSYEPVSFGQLRALADNYDLLRLVIETRKDQIERLDWSFRLREMPGEPPAKRSQRESDDKRIEALYDFFRRPDGEHSFKRWMRTILEDLFVIDAVSVLPRWRIDGGIYAFDVIDGATISRRLDAEGRTPMFPDVAYQQYIHGVPIRNLAAPAPEMRFGDQLIYLPRNVRPNKIYGYSPVEQVIMTVNIALRRQLFQLQYYSEGNVPDALVTMPEGWTPDQIATFEQMWNALNANTAERRKMKFLPPTSEPHWTQERTLKDEMDEWLARIIAFAFSIPPSALVKIMNRATGQKLSEDAKAEGLETLTSYLKDDLMDPLVQEWIGFDDVEFVFGELTRENPLQRAQIDQIYIQEGVKSVRTAQQELGLDPDQEEENEKKRREALPPPALMFGAPGNGDGKNPGIVKDDKDVREGEGNAKLLAKKNGAPSRRTPLGRSSNARSTRSPMY